MALGFRKKRNHPEPVSRLIRFEATDGIALGGLLYEPARTSKDVLIWLHGTGGSSIFDSKRTNPLAAEIVRQGLAFFPFNNRGAHVMRRMAVRSGKRSSHVQGGAAYELIRECVADIDGAIRDLRARGYSRFHLAGHSTGANKIVIYDQLKRRNPVASYLLVAGGDDTGMFYEQLGPRKFRATLERANTMIKARRGMELVPSSISDVPMSWRSFFDMANPDGEYNVFPFLEALEEVKLSRKPPFWRVKTIKKPVLAIYGENDEYLSDVSAAVSAMANAIGPRENFEFAIMRNADHSFTGREATLGELMATWATSF